MTIINPGISDVAAESRTPKGTAPLGSLQASGIVRVKMSAGEGEEVAEYGHAIACELVIANAYS